MKKSKDDRIDKADKKDVSKDASLNAGLVALATAVGAPIGWNGLGMKPAAIPLASGKGFYFLWSLEHVAVALNLETIGKKDWYNWGAEILLASQGPAGGWHGDYAGSEPFRHLLWACCSSRRPTSPATCPVV